MLWRSLTFVCVIRLSRMFKQPWHTFPLGGMAVGHFHKTAFTRVCNGGTDIITNRRAGSIPKSARQMRSFPREIRLRKPLPLDSSTKREPKQNAVGCLEGNIAFSLRIRCPSRPPTSRKSFFLSDRFVCIKIEKALVSGGFISGDSRMGITCTAPVVSRMYIPDGRLHPGWIPKGCIFYDRKVAR